MLTSIDILRNCNNPKTSPAMTQRGLPRGRLARVPEIAIYLSECGNSPLRLKTHGKTPRCTRKIGLQPGNLSGLDIE
jgi:hypothetical protein